MCLRDEDAVTHNLARNPGQVYHGNVSASWQAAWIHVRINIQSQLAPLHAPSNPLCSPNSGLQITTSQLFDTIAGLQCWRRISCAGLYLAYLALGMVGAPRQRPTGTGESFMVFT